MPASASDHTSSAASAKHTDPELKGVKPERDSESASASSSSAAAGAQPNLERPLKRLRVQKPTHSVHCDLTSDDGTLVWTETPIEATPPPENVLDIT